MRRDSVKKRSGNQRNQSFERTIPQHEVSRLSEKEEEEIFRKGSTDTMGAEKNRDEKREENELEKYQEEDVQSDDWLFTFSPVPVRIPIPKWRCLRGEEFSEHIVGRFLEETIRSFDRAICERNIQELACRFASQCFHEAFCQLHLWANPSHEWESSSEWDHDVEPQTSSKDCWLSMRGLDTDIFEAVPPLRIESTTVGKNRENSRLPRENSAVMGVEVTSTSNGAESSTFTKTLNEQRIPELPEESHISTGKSENAVNLVGKERSALSSHSREKVHIGRPPRSAQQLQPGLITSKRSQGVVGRPEPKIFSERLEIQYTILPVAGEVRVKRESAD